jgi:hypothetical protein
MPEVLFDADHTEATYAAAEALRALLAHRDRYTARHHRHRRAHGNAPGHPAAHGGTADGYLLRRHLTGIIHQCEWCQLIAVITQGGRQGVLFRERHFAGDFIP